MAAKSRKPARKKSANATVRNKPARKPVSKKGNRKPVRKKPASKPVRNKPANKRVSQKPAPQGRYKAEPISTQIEATTNDWPSKIEPSPEFRKTKTALWNRWRALGDIKEFVWETARLKLRFERAYQDQPDVVRKFFRPAFTVSLVNDQGLEDRIRGVDNEFGSLLRRYVDYAVRYGVQFRLFREAPYFRVGEGQGVVNDRFQVVIRNGGFEPRGYLPPDTAFSDGFESDVTATPSELERLVREGLAKYVVIDDEEPLSLLRQMFSFAYSPNHVTVFRYCSPPRHTLILVGQNVSLPEVWPRLRKVVAADQRTSTKSDQRGASPNLRRLHALLNTIMRGTDTQSVKAARFVRDKVSAGYPERLASMESQLSQLKRQLEQ
jgi:hypothetical protein